MNRSLLLSRLIKSTTMNRPITTSVMTMEKAMETLEANPYFDKYANKISAMQKTAPQEFLNRFVKADEVKSPSARFSQVAEKSKVPLPNGAFAFAPQKKLDSIMKMELLDDKRVKEIEFIWNEHFSSRDAISGVVPSELYERIATYATAYPTFLLPLPRDDGYEFVVAQFAAHEIHFTPLINYQAYKENAPECLTMIHYPELKESKGIVLMHGEFDTKMITAQEAQFIANQMTLYYSGDDAHKTSLLDIFHRRPQEFCHTDLIKEIETVCLQALQSKD